MKSMLVFAAALAAVMQPRADENTRPDLIWIMAEDISNELSCYGEPGVRTPNIDRLAADGVRYEQAYCTAPACSTSRSAMMSGVYQTRIDAQDHRRVGNATFPAFTEALRQAGYYIAGGCGYSAKTDLNFKPTEKVFDGKDWSKAREGQPFFAQITLYGTHRLDTDGREWRAVREASPHPVDPAAVRLPPYFPDVPAVRMDWALYLDQIQAMDGQVGEIIARLKKEGRYEDALIVFCGDNGRCHLRAKNWLYEPGLRVPLIIKWPGDARAGEVVEGMVSMLDIAPTLLQAAGTRPLRPLDGQSLAGPDPAVRTMIFGARDGSGEVMDHIRSVCNGRWKYIRNYKPEIGYQESRYTIEHRPMLPVMQEMRRAGTLDQAQQLVLLETKPAEELYDLETDPYEIHNLASEPQSADVLQQLREALDAWIEETGDTGLAGMSWEPAVRNQ